MSFVSDIPPSLQDRIRHANDRPSRPDADHVLCWLQQTLRADDNPALEVALFEAHRRGLPVLVYHGLRRDYPHASHRLHRFILEASRSLEEALQERGIAFVRHVETESHQERGLVARLAERAAMVVTDDQAVFVARQHTEALAGKIDVALLAVDAACLVPVRTLPDGMKGTSRFRKQAEPRRDRYLEPYEVPPPAAELFRGPLPFEPTPQALLQPELLDDLIASCGVDMTLPPTKSFCGDRAAAESQLAWALDRALPEYDKRRTNPADDAGGSGLSPYLHFGVLGPREVVRAAQRLDIRSTARTKFFDELLNWREWFHYLALQSPDPCAYENLPEWARETLDDHRDDPREAQYTLEKLVHGETADETWNASQKQFLYEGYLHNNLRMYWANRLLAWLPSPEVAWDTACYLNDRFSLDGRDPATYGNIQWCFGRTKSAEVESPIYGWVPIKPDKWVRRREGVSSWLAAESARDDFRVRVPESLPGDRK